MSIMRTVFTSRSHLRRLLVILCVFSVFWYLWSRKSIEGDVAGKKGVQGYIKYQDVVNIAKRNHRLTFKNRKFYLGGSPFTILSGAIHYFRVVPEYWKDRLLKLKACGLNTVETYVSWNLHEPVPGKFVFTGMLDIRKYIQTAQEIGLYVILRPGPYICSEWDFGGLPSWLLADPNMKVRSNYPGYKKAAERFFENLLPRIRNLQYSQGGPIIAVQVENEFGSYSNETKHLTFLKDLLHQNGIMELLVTSDNLNGMNRAPFHDDALPMANFKFLAEGLKIFEKIKKMNRDFPLMVLEFWTGWFDHWGVKHKGFVVSEYSKALGGILKEKASVNLYMFHGGTNFGFMAGANYFDKYKPDVTSYDYDAPLSEDGHITEKYVITKKILMNSVLKEMGIHELAPPPERIPRVGYGTVKIISYLPYNYVVEAQKDNVELREPAWMEMLKLSSGYGQSYGYIVYRKQIRRGSKIIISGTVRDRALILVDGKLTSVLESHVPDQTVKLPQTQSSLVTLDIMVENLGRVNYVSFMSPRLNQQRKGINGTVFLDGTPQLKWQVYPLDFRNDHLMRISSSKQWKPFAAGTLGPHMCRAVLNITDKPRDTFLWMKGWHKGVVFINGFNLGRYWIIGPQKTLYVPAPLLVKGDNEVLIFEEEKSDTEIVFVSDADLD